MVIIKDILNIIELEHEFNIEKNANSFVARDTQGMLLSPPTKESGNFIDYWQYTRRDRDEFWSSFDVFLIKEKTELALELISEFLLRNSLIEESFNAFNKVINNHSFFKLENNEGRFDIVKVNEQLSIRITHFE